MMEILTNGDVNELVIDDEIARKTDRIETQISQFKKEYSSIDKAIKDISNNLISENGILNYNLELDSLTRRVREIDDLVRVINADIRIFEELYGDSTSFSIEPSVLVNYVVELKENLKNLKVLQVSNYVNKIDAVNKKILELKALRNEQMPLDVAIMIDSLREFDKEYCNVTDWKYNKYKKINLKNIDAIYRNILFIERKLKLDRISPYIEKLDGFKTNIDNKIEEIDGKINDDMSMDDISNVKQGLRELVSLIYAFGTDLYYCKNNITDLQHIKYSQAIRETRSRFDYLNNKLVSSKVYKNIKDELDSQLKDVSIRIDVLCRYVNIHHGNANEAIVEFDRSELFILEKEFEYVKNKIESRSSQLVNSQYDSLVRLVKQTEDKLKEAKGKIYDENMLNKKDLYVISLEEIESGLQEIEDMLSEITSVNKNDGKFISDRISYLQNKIQSMESMINTNRDKDSKQYEVMMNSLNGFKQRLRNVSEEYEKKKPLRVKMVKSGKKVFEKHNKLILCSAGIIAITLLIRKFLLIPAIMHGNVMMGAVSPALQGTTSFFNKILGGIIGASMDVNGVWHLANGAVINSSVATTSLLKGLVTGMAGFSVSVVPILVLSVKELVEEMKLKERKKKLMEIIYKKDMNEENIELGVSRRGK